MGGDTALTITDAMISIDHELTHLPAKSALQLIEFCRRRLDASEARILADRYDKGASDRDVENMAGGDDNKTSKKEAKKRARRAKATNANPDIADRLANGTLSSEQADIIADAAEETDGAAACDEELIETVSSTNPEQGRKKARSYVNKTTSAKKVQKRYDKQRRLRGVYKHRLEIGNSAITIHGSNEDIDEIERNIHAGSNSEYERDGGRHVPNAKHPRTRDQRNFDAAHKLLTKPSDDTATKKALTKGRQATVFVTATVDQLSGKDSSPFTSLDGKPLPDSYVDDIAGGSTFIAQLFSAAGELLWQGLSQRLATTAQINGLISRDRGCVQCGASVDKCVAHHLLPANAPRKGPTNINNLALLCHDCHYRLHQAKRTMFFDMETQAWITRPATPDEIPPDRPGRAAADRKPPPDRYSRNETPNESQKPQLWERPPLPGIRPPLSKDGDLNYF